MKKLALTLAAVMTVSLATAQNASAEVPFGELNRYFEIDIYVSTANYPTEELALAAAEARIKGGHNFHGQVSPSSTPNEWKILAEVEPVIVPFDSGDHYSGVSADDARAKANNWAEQKFGHYWMTVHSYGGSKQEGYRAWIQGEAYHPDFIATELLIIR